MPNMKAMEDDEKEESKREKIRQILKAGTKAAAKVALEGTGAEVEAEDDDECGVLLLDVSVGFSGRWRRRDAAGGISRNPSQTGTLTGT